MSDDVRPLMNESSESDSTVTDRIKDVQGNSNTKTYPGRKQIAHNLNPIIVAQLGQDGASLPFGYTAGKKHQYNCFSGYHFSLY